MVLQWRLLTSEPGFLATKNVTSLVLGLTLAFLLLFHSMIQFYMGKRVAYVYKAKRTVKDSKVCVACHGAAP